MGKSNGAVFVLAYTSFIKRLRKGTQWHRQKVSTKEKRRILTWTARVDQVIYDRSGFRQIFLKQIPANRTKRYS